LSSTTEKAAQNDAETLLLEVARIVLEELQKREEIVQKIVSRLTISELEYKKAITAEVARSVAIEARYAFLPNANYAPANVKNNALCVLLKKLGRDQRIYGAT
jgi:hypothetical protein